MMHLKQGNQGEIKASRKGAGRARDAWVWIGVALVVAVLLVGCIVREKITQNTTENAIFSVEKSKREAPKTPITVSMSMPATLVLNKVSDINISVASVRDAPNTRIDLILPEGASLVSGKSTWEVNLTANTPATFSAKIMMTKTGNWVIKAVAIRIIDKENSWGDMDIAYIGYQPLSNATQGARAEKNRS